MAIRGLLVELTAQERTTLLRIAHGHADRDTHDPLHVARLLSLQLVNDAQRTLALT
jgi:hypothetical protein